jgi:photosystem II stability/assembly factor-like uncharacterized protein
MRWSLFLLWSAFAAGQIASTSQVASTIQAEPRLHACVVNAKAWVVGARLAASGLAKLDAQHRWQQLGFVHPMILAADYDRGDPSTLYLAGGNGLIRARRSGNDWRITTGWEVTELRDVTVDPQTPGTVYFSHTEGIRKSTNGGDTWSDADHGIDQKYCETLQADRAQKGRVLAGCANGIFLTENGGQTWKRTGAEGLQVRRVVQSPHQPHHWLAGTQMGGLLRSMDGGLSWEAAGDVSVERNIYDIAFDPTTPGRIALGGWSTGVLVSQDNGKTWDRRSNGLPRWDIWSLAFHPSHPGLLYASVHEEALYVSDDAGRNWRSAGMEGSFVYRLHFFPEVGQ